MTQKNITRVFEQQQLFVARMVGGSKTVYRNTHPDNEVYFNANIFTEEQGKVWYGDLDLTLDTRALKKVAKQLNTKLYILREMDGRFGTEQLGPEWVKSKAVSVVNPT